jgi:hypothetical protein
LDRSAADIISFYDLNHVNPTDKEQVGQFIENKFGYLRNIAAIDEQRIEDEAGSDDDCKQDGDQPTKAKRTGQYDV